MMRHAVLFGAFAVALLATAAVRAHDIPNDVIVHAFIKPEGQRLRLLVRVPLKAMMDVEFPSRGPGYLDIARAEAPMRDAATVWIAQNIQLYEEDARLPDGQLMAVRASLPSDQSFQSYATALAHVNGPRLPDDIELPWEQAMLDTLLEYPIASDTSRFAIAPQLHRLGTRVTTALRLITPGRAERAFELHDDAGLVWLDPRWHQAAWRFVQSGFFHILGGVDHLLFLLCLVIPLRRMRALILVVTAFTVAHSITLDRIRVRPGAVGALVPAAGGDADRDVDRLHGAGEHHGYRAAAPVDPDVCLRPRARLRVLVRAARVAAVCRLSPVDVARCVQPGGGGRADPCTAGCWCRRWDCCSGMRWRSASARSSCRRSWPTRRGTGCRSAPVSSRSSPGRG